MGEIFISYKREEISTARRVRQALCGERLDVWWDENLQGGQQWAEEIDRALFSAAVVVVLWSAASVHSDWVKHEASIAKSRSTLVPVVISSCSIPPAFERTQCVSLVGWEGSERDAGFRDLLNAVRRLIWRRRRARILRGMAIGTTVFILFGLGIQAGRHMSASGPQRPVVIGAHDDQEGDDAQATKDESLPELAQLGKKYGRRYVLEAVTMTWRLDFAAGASQPKSADVRTVYTIFALEDLSPEKGSDFAEQYHTGVPGARVVYLQGSEQEKETERAVQNKQWSVLFSLKKGQRRTIVTGAKILYPAEMPGHGDSHGFGKLGAREQALYYPNLEDVIGELTILVQSESMTLQQPQYDDAGTWDEAWTKRDEAGPPTLTSSDSEGIRHSVLTARWTKLVPKQNAGVRVRW